MNPRQQHALTHPLNRIADDTAPYRSQRRHATSLLLVAILAVDR